MRHIFLLVVLLAVLAGGCSDVDGPLATPSPQPSPTVTVRAEARPTAAGAQTDDTAALVWWTPEFSSPFGEQPGAPLIEEYLAEFATSHGDTVRVIPVVKARYGKGGLLDYLRTAQAAAPGTLPDVVVLDASELEQAAALGVLQPLDGLIPEEAMARLYPFARTLGRIGDKLYGVPFAADFEHLVYHRDQLERPPSSWAGVLTGEAPYLVPTGPPAVPSTVQPSALSHYLSAGGRLDPETRQMVLEAEPLARLLAFFDEARSTGLLPLGPEELENADQSWNAYLQGAAPMAIATARQYLAARDDWPTTGAAPLPGWSEAASPIANGWILAIVTPDPERQKMAAEFIAGLLEPQRAGAWSQSAGWVPTSPAALAAWERSPYAEFLDRQLADAFSPPVGAGSLVALSRLQQAVSDVAGGERSPDEAAQSALVPPD